MPAHSASEDARERAYSAGIHVFCASGEDADGTANRACPSCALSSAASRVNPTCGDKPGHDVSLWLDAYPSTHCAQRHVRAPGHGGRIRKFRLVGRRVAKGTHVIFF